jgi:hypothetical protein
MAEPTAIPLARIVAAPPVPAGPAVPAPLAIAVQPAGPLSAGAIGVVARAPELSEYEELDERPAGSKIAVDQSAHCLTIVVPPAGMQANRTLLAGGIFVCLVAVAFSHGLFAEHSAGSLLLMVFLSLAAWATGIGLLLMSFDRARRCFVLDVAGGVLTVSRSGLFRVRRWRWSEQQLADILVMHDPGDSESPGDSWELQIYPRPTQDKMVALLGDRDVAELRWLATLLRKTLHCPANSESSPPPGFVVQSPHLRALLQRRM